MMALRHHPHGETLISHAAGTLDPALSVVLSCHLQFCERCRAHLRAMDDVGGILLDGFKAPEDEDFFKRAMRRFAVEVAQEVGSVLPPKALDPGNEVLMPAPIARATGLRREAILHSERHGGQLILVLWGSYNYDGDRFERGDLHDISESGFRTFKGASPEGVTFFTAISPVPQLTIFRTGH